VGGSEGEREGGREWVVRTKNGAITARASRYVL
jgi:hypothetical protein